MKIKHQTYKGFGITLVHGVEYRAKAYANPSFIGRNLAKIKRAINQYLRDEAYTDVHETYHIK